MKRIEKNEFNCTQKASVKSGFTELDKITNSWNSTWSKVLAKDLNIPIIVFNQLRDGINDKRLQLSNLRASFHTNEQRCGRGLFFHCPELSYSY